MSELDRHRIKKELVLLVDDMPLELHLSKKRTSKFLSFLKSILLLVETDERLSESYDHLKKTKDELLAERSRLSAEVEKLRKAKYIFSTVDYCADDLAKALEENKRLIEERDEAIVACKIKGVPLPYALETIHTFCQKQIKKAKVDTVRKMLERIKEDAISVSLLSNPPKFMLEIREDALDQIAKEIEEGIECQSEQKLSATDAAQK